MNITIDQTRREKRAVFEVSLRLIKEGKFHATPMAEIAYLSKISESLMELVFETRDNLLAELSGITMQKIEREIAEAIKNSDGFRDAIFNSWIALYQFYTRNPDTISFVEQFDNIRPPASQKSVTHPGKSPSLSGLFSAQHSLSTDASPATLVWLLHENALGAAKMNVLNQSLTITPPRKLAEFFWKGLANEAACIL
jgi:hypothetical protein